MPLNLEAIHEYQRIPGTQQVRLVRTNPAVRITAEGQPSIWIQEGIAYFEGGERVPLPVPKWFLEEISKLTPGAKQECGLTEATLRALTGGK